MNSTAFLVIAALILITWVVFITIVVWQDHIITKHVNTVSVDLNKKIAVVEERIANLTKADMIAINNEIKAIVEEQQSVIRTRELMDRGIHWIPRKKK